MHARTLGLIGLLFTLTTSSAVAQTARLYGTATDSGGHVLSGVHIEARQGTLVRTTTTNDGGAYELAGLAAGRYQVSFRLIGFATVVQRAVTLADGASESLDAALQLSLSTDVLVTAKKTFRNLADVDARGADLVGVAASASEGVISAQQLEDRPAYRVGEVLETVPGVVISQHSGEGKANQYYVRGFNIDHGTDLATTVAGVPVNLPTHGHGQGYSDLNFLIPELVSGVQFRKGPYYAEEGDFSSAGAINVNYLNVVDRPTLTVEGGPNAYGRLLAIGSPRIGDGHLLYGAELLHHDGPWVTPDDYRKLNGVLRYSRGTQQRGFSITAMAYDGEWTATDQVPRRAVDNGSLDRFGSLDPTDGGRARRLSLSGQWRASGAQSQTDVSAFAISSRLNLYSNFTYFLDDPINGDQFEQEDRRTVAGAKLTHRWMTSWGQRDVENVAGLQLRNDWIPTVGLYHTRERSRLETVRQDDVTQRSAAVFAQSAIQCRPWLRTVVGLRGDLYHFDVASNDAANSGTATSSLLSPKLTVVFGPWSHTEIYANLGSSFHSNDGRGATLTRDPKTGEPAERVDPLVRARGAEVGLRTTALKGFQSTLTFWGLDIGSELVFVGDAGTTEASRPSRRLGFEWTNYFSPTPWLTVDADVASSRARFRDEDPAGNRIPGAAEGVAAVGMTLSDRRGVSGSLRLRYFGPRPLLEDNSVRSDSSVTLNARLAYRFSRRYVLSAELFNIMDATVSDVDYYYPSRLTNEPAKGIDDIHTHPLESRTFRLGLSATF